MTRGGTPTRLTRLVAVDFGRHEAIRSGLARHHEERQGAARACETAGQRWIKVELVEACAGRVCSAATKAPAIAARDLSPWWF